MSKNNAVKVRDGIIVLAIVLNLAYFKWRSNHPPTGPVKSITSVSARDIIGEPANVPGDVKSPYVLVEFGDYQCPPCAHLFPEIDDLLSRNRRKLRFQFRQYPLPGHLLAFPAAMLAESARRSDRFEQVHRALYALGPKSQQSDLIAIANTYHVRCPSPSAPVDLDRQLEFKIVSDKEEDSKVPVEGTPSLYLCTPDQKVLEVHSAAQIEEVIR